MRTCNCTLPYTNPKACENCSNNIKYDFNKSYEYKPIIIKGICLHTDEKKDYKLGQFEA